MEATTPLSKLADPLYVLLVTVPAVIALISVKAFFSVAVMVALVTAVSFLARRFEYLLFFIFLLVAWFPEYSQTDWDVWSAEDFRSLYNYTPLSTITASVFDYVFAMIVLVWLLVVALPRIRELLHLPLAKEMLYFFGMCVVSLMFGLFQRYETYYALREFRVSAYFVLTFLMWITTVNTDEKRSAFINMLVGSAFCIGIYGIVRYVLGIGKTYYNGTLLVYYDIGDSMVLYLALFVLAAAWFRFPGRRLWFALLACPMAFSLLYSYRRGAWIAGGLGLLYIIIRYRPLHKTTTLAAGRRWMVPVLAVAITVIVVSTTSESYLVVERAESVLDTQDDPSNVFRLMDAMNALTTFVRHPALGVGFGGRYDREYYSEAVAPAEFWDSADRASHNGYLFILYKMGAIGFLAYAYLLWRFVRLWRQRRTIVLDVTSEVAMWGCGVGAMAILINNMTSPVTDSLRPAILLAIMMGCVVTIIHSHSRSNSLIHGHTI